VLDSEVTKWTLWPTAAGKQPKKLSNSLQYVCLQTSLPVANRALPLLQAIADTEGEITKRKVQIAAAAKQTEKLSKDCVKTQKELDKANADLEGKQQEQQVCTDRQGTAKEGLSRLPVPCYALSFLSACFACTLTRQFQKARTVVEHVIVATRQSWVLMLKAN